MAIAAQSPTRRKPAVPFPAKLALNRSLFGLVRIATADGAAIHVGDRVSALDALNAQFQIGEKRRSEL